MKRIQFVVPALALFLGAAGLCTAKAASGVPVGASPAAYGQDRGGWDAPPQELQETQRRGFHDGIEGARKDMDNHRRPDVNNRDEYRQPSVHRDERDAYREGFRRGYELGISHLMGGPEQPMGAPGQQMREPERGGQNMGPGMNPGMGEGMGSDVQRRGFQEGMEGARKDMDNHRRPNVRNRDEYRHPNIARAFQNEYREAFRRGYERGMSQQMGRPERHY